MFESIKELSTSYPLNTVCHVLNVNKSSYLYWLNTGLSNESIKLEFFQLVIQVYAEFNGIYGAPKITFVLKARGIFCSVSKVSRTMHILGIKSIVSKHFPTKKSRITDKEKSLIINLIKDLDIVRLNQVWTTDVTYIKTLHEGSFYLISFLDAFSKKVIAWGLYNNQQTDKIIATLNVAVSSRKPSPGLIVHSDKGSQFRSHIYRAFLSKHNFIFSYTSLDHSCDENAAQESFHASLKKECLYLNDIYTFNDAYKLIFDYIEGFYNPSRIHSSIGYLSPNDFEKIHKNTKNPL